jgi:tRNA/tmRNA/rRNA uracil-C5-methylase (TrmA/RlmC/RlmD family)
MARRAPESSFSQQQELASSPRDTEISTEADDVLVELRTGSMAAGGGCVARAPDGRVVFVRHSLPGELVRARITAETTSYLRADAVEILEPAATRVNSPCEHAGAGRCGGCDWQHIALDAQREQKALLVSEQLRRLAGIDPPVVIEEVPGAPNGLGWRTRVRFAVDRRGKVGLRQHRSHDLEYVEHCPIASHALEALGIENARWPGAQEVEAFSVHGSISGNAPQTGGDESVVLVVPGRSGIRPDKLPQLAGTSAGMVVEDHVVREPAHVHVEVLGHRFRVTAGSFWQVHVGAPLSLATAVLEGLEPNLGERVVDLFAGVGLFSVMLASAVGPSGQVTAVERQRRACADARHNAQQLPQVQVMSRAVTPELVAELGHVDLVVLDPPREGAGRALTGALCAMRPAPRRIGYVACDASSFARDLRVALDAGWTLASLRGFDQFPMTEHVELFAILEPPMDA